MPKAMSLGAPLSERFEIAVDPPECLEGAMIYLCLLAYPLAKDDAKRARLFDAFWAYSIRAARYNKRLRKGGSSHHSEVLRKIPTQQMWGTLSRANRRIWWRIVAAERFLFYGSMPTTTRRKKRRRDPADINRDRFWIKNPVLPLPKGFSGGRRFAKKTGYASWYVEEYEYTDEQKKPTVTDVVRAVSRQIRMPERNVWSQIVRPTRPVLHMADALRCMMLEQLDHTKLDLEEDESSSGFDCLTLVRRPDWVKRAVSIACTTARYWAAYREWPALQAIDPAEFIELVVRE